MPYTKVLIHYIWSTKNRTHLITKELKKKTYAEEYQEFLTAHHFKVILAKANVNSLKQSTT